ncbi:putative F-box protein [Arabidopsis thaliana]
MNTRSGDAEGDIRGKMIAPVRDGNGGQKRKLVQSNDIQRDEDGGAKRRIIQSSDQKNGKILRGIHGCVSPRCSAPTYQSRFSWYEQDIWTYITRFWMVNHW